LAKVSSFHIPEKIKKDSLKMVAKKELVFLLPRRGKPSQIEKKLMEMFDSKGAEEEEEKGRTTQTSFFFSSAVSGGH
jgi:hypothetical protein